MDRACPVCGDPVTGRPNKVYCQRSCYHTLRQRRALGIADVPFERQCGYCEQPFRSKDGRRGYCGDECTSIAKGLREVRRRYGLTMDQYRTLWRDQGGKCAICEQSERTARNRLLCVDHDHESGAVRGLLCSQCNRAIGLLGDSPATLLKAASYVARPIPTDATEEIPRATVQN